MQYRAALLPRGVIVIGAGYIGQPPFTQKDVKSVVHKIKVDTETVAVFYEEFKLLNNVFVLYQLNVLIQQLKTGYFSKKKQLFNF